MLAIHDMGKARVSVVADPESLDPQSVLHPAEFKKWRSMSSRRARNFLHGRYALKRLLPRDTNLSDRLVIPDPSGKPFLHEEPSVFCSISHTDAFAVAATSVHSAVGVDIEKIAPRHPALLRSIWNTEEVAHLSTLFDQEIIPTLVWSIKEAAAKADSEIFPFNQYRIVVRDTLMVERQTKRWSITISLLPSHVCVLATETGV